jgi:hypothetical protein
LQDKMASFMNTSDAGALPGKPPTASLAMECVLSLARVSG